MKGFTIVEVIVVAVIIAILAAVAISLLQEDSQIGAVNEYSVEVIQCKILLQYLEGFSCLKNILFWIS